MAALQLNTRWSDWVWGVTVGCWGTNYWLMVSNSGQSLVTLFHPVICLLGVCLFMKQLPLLIWFSVCVFCVCVCVRACVCVVIVIEDSSKSWVAALKLRAGPRLIHECWHNMACEYVSMGRRECAMKRSVAGDASATWGIRVLAYHFVALFKLSCNHIKMYLVLDLFLLPRFFYYFFLNF